MDRKTEKFIINLLRRGTLKYPGRREAILRVRKRFKEGKTRKGKTKWKWWYRCEECDYWFRDESDLEVDHIEEVGEYKGDLHDYAERMYNFGDNAQAICIKCHRRKTTASAKERWGRKKLKKKKLKRVWKD